MRERQKDSYLVHDHVVLFQCRFVAFTEILFEDIHNTMEKLDDEQRWNWNETNGRPMRELWTGRVRSLVSTARK
jgi:hypothetical protein